MSFTCFWQHTGVQPAKEHETKNEEDAYFQGALKQKVIN
jgi:hypothetical protein